MWFYTFTTPTGRENILPKEMRLVGVNATAISAGGSKLMLTESIHFTPSDRVPTPDGKILNTFTPLSKSPELRNTGLTNFSLTMIQFCRKGNATVSVDEEEKVLLKQQKIK